MCFSAGRNHPKFVPRDKIVRQALPILGRMSNHHVRFSPLAKTHFVLAFNTHTCLRSVRAANARTLLLLWVLVVHFLVIKESTCGCVWTALRIFSVCRYQFDLRQNYGDEAFSISSLIRYGALILERYATLPLSSLGRPPLSRHFCTVYRYF